MEDPLSYKDFMPRRDQYHYERFKYLMEEANDWLQSHPDRRVVTCQSLQVKERFGSNTFNGGKGTFNERGGGYNNYIRVLRLWVRASRPFEPPGPQLLRYLDVVPLANDSLAVTLSKLNIQLATDPIHGRLVNIETLAMKCHERLGQKVDPEESEWSQNGGNFLRVLRIFFEIGEPAYEELGCADFVPSKCTLYYTKYESFNRTLSKARDWLEAQKGIRFVSVESVEYKLKKDDEGETDVLDTHRASYAAYSSCVRYVRIIRVFYARPMEGLAQNTLLPPMPSLHYKTFIPTLDDDEGRAYNSMSEMWHRINTWLRATGVINYLSAELTWLRLSSMKTEVNPDEETYAKHHTGADDTRLAAVRLYVDGSFVEPTPGGLSVLAEQQTDCCALQ